MTQYVFDLDSVGDRSSLSDGDVFTITPYLPNDEITRVQVGFCSGVYDVVCAGSGQPLEPGFFLSGVAYEITWDATNGRFTTDCAPFDCALFGTDDVFTWFDVPPAVPLQPTTRTLWLVAEAPKAVGNAEVYFYYGDSDGPPLPPALGAPWIPGQDTNPDVDGADYEVRMVRDDPLTNWPSMREGDPVDTWLPMTTERSWGFTAFYAAGFWVPVELGVRMEFRAARAPVDCTVDFYVYLESGVVS